MTTRRIERILKSRPTREGAGVHLKRAFGYSQVPMFDPFLMLDDFHTSNPDEYMAGFPWHPHRGIETITYVLQGLVEHGDSMGNKGAIGEGDVQWMTAGSGIIHQEMPKESPSGVMWGFQLWANLPARHKMMPPRYRDVKASQIPEVTLENGVRARVVSGEAGEAIKTVQYTPLKKWVDRGDGGHYVVKRLREADRILTPEAVAKLRQAASKFQGKPYDLTFEWSDDRIYCSELVWKIYDRGLGLRIGRLQRLRDFDLSDPIVEAKMKERYGNAIPMEETVISPGEMFSFEGLSTVADH